MLICGPLNWAFAPVFAIGSVVSTGRAGPVGLDDDPDTDADTREGHTGNVAGVPPVSTVVIRLLEVEHGDVGGIRSTSGGLVVHLLAVAAPGLVPGESRSVAADSTGDEAEADGAATTGERE